MKESKNIKSKATKTTAKAVIAKAPAVANPAKRTVKKKPATMPLAASGPKTAAPASPAFTAPPREITTELIAQRAYIIWEQQGRPHGHDKANWLLAEKQLKQEIHSFTA